MIYPNEKSVQPFFPNAEKDIILEVHMNGKIRFDILLNTIYSQFGIAYKIINADLEYINGNNFGNIQLKLRVDEASLEYLDNYLKKYKLVNSQIDVTTKKEAS